MPKNKHLTIFYSLIFFTFLACHKPSEDAFYEPTLRDAVHNNGIYALFREADAYKYAQDYPRAAMAFERLLHNQQLQTADERHYALNQLAYCALKMNQDSTAKHWLTLLSQDEAPLSMVAQGDAALNRGLLNYRLFKPKLSAACLHEAIRYYTASYDSTHLKMVETYTALGMMHYEFAHTPDSGTVYLKKARDIFKKQPQLKRFSAECLLGMAMIARTNRQIDEMIGYCEESIEILEHNKSLDSVLIARCWAFKARGLNGRYQRAKNYADSTKIYEKIVAYYETSVSICPKSSSRLQECLYEEARFFATINSKGEQKYTALFERAVDRLTQVIQLQKNDRYGQIPRLEAYRYYFQGKHDSVVLCFAQYISFYQSDSAIHRYRLSESYALLANCYEQIGVRSNRIDLLDSALHCFKMNLLNYANDKDFHKSWDNILKPSFYEKSALQFVPLSVVVEIFYKKYRISKKTQFLDKSLRAANVVDALLFSGINSQDEDAYDMYYLQAAESIFQAGINSAYDLFAIKGGQKYLDYVFRYGERMRSFLLYRAADIRRGDSLMNYPPKNLIDSLRQLEREINQLKWDLENGYSFNSRLKNRLEDRDKLFSYIRGKFPEYFRNKVIQPIPTVSHVQRCLNPEQRFVQYTFVDTFLYAIFIDKTKIKIHRIIWRESEDSLVKKLVSSLNGNSINVTPQYHLETSFHLFKSLFPDGLRGKRELIVSPDGQLNLLPFEVLVNQYAKDLMSFKQLNYIVHDLAISYTPSWKIYETNSRVKLSSKPKIVAYTYDFGSKELSYAEEEFKFLNDLFGSNALLLKGKDCSKQNFLNNRYGQYDILHLSLHARSDAQSKLSNVIYFSPRFRDSLMGFELLDRNFRESLVVLSACQTAYGKIKKGEGTFTLSRYLLRSGVPHVIASLWPIPDASTAQITNLFYQNITQGCSISVALQKAKVDYLKRSPNSKCSPRYWGGLINID